MAIRVGDLVEISSQEDGFLGSYFRARVVESVKPANGKFTVEYETLLSDEDKNKRLREVVCAADVRPFPLAIKVLGFDVMQLLDVYDGDGWWMGRVTGRVGEDRYSVYFDSTGDEFEYSGWVLRVHQLQEWEDGIWVPSESKNYGFSD